MKIVGGLSTLALLGLLIAGAGVCAVSEGSIASSAHGAELCCGVTYCSMVAVGTMVIGLWVAAARLIPPAVRISRLLGPQPISLPPERPILLA